MSAPAKSAAPSSPSPRRRGRILRRVLLSLVLLLLIGGIAVWAYRVEVVNAVLAKFLPDLPVSVDGISYANGKLVAENISLELTQGGPPAIKIPKAEVGFSGDIRKLGKVTLTKPEIRLEEGFWAAVQQEKGTPELKAKAAAEAFSLAGLEIKDASVMLKTAEGREFSGKLNWSGAAVELTPAGALAAGLQSIRIDQAKVIPGKGMTAVDLGGLAMDFEIDAEKRHLTVRHLRSKDWNFVADTRLWTLLGMVPSASPSVAPETQPIGPESMAVVESFAVEDCQIEGVTLEVRDIPGFEQMPPIKAVVSLTSTLLSPATDAAGSGQLLHLQLRNLSVAEAGEAAWVECPSLSVDAEMMPDKNFRIARGRVEPTKVAIGPAELKKMGFGAVPMPEIRATLSLNAGEMVVGASGLTMREPTDIELLDYSARVPGNADPLIAGKALRASGSWDELRSSKRLRSLELEEPTVRLTAAKLSYFESAAPSTTTSQPSRMPQTTQIPFWEGVFCDVIRIQGGSAAASGMGPGIPDLALKFAAQTAPLGGAGGDSFYQLNLTDLIIGQTDKPTGPPQYQGRGIQLAVHPREVWARQAIEQIRFTGSRVDIGATDEDATMLVLQETAVKPLEHTQLAPSVSAEEAPQGWHVKELTFDDTRLHLHRLVPDVSEIFLPIARKTFFNFPLTSEGMAQHDREERLELPLVHIPGTRAGASVADLDTNFLHFTLSGLMRKEIRRVQLVNPKIYVGDSLFHYVEKLRTEAATVPVDDSAKSAALQILLGCFAQLGGETGPPAPKSGEKGWSIQRLQAVNGKLITTVKDSPILRVPPLPFGADSSLEDNQIDAELAIPPGLYKPLLGMDLVTLLEGGTIKFNLPRKGEANNLVQVFRAQWLRYKQFRISDVKLAVTYDENGIYTQFWSTAYGGYLQGAFNLYLDDQMSWDMWVSGTGIGTGELTKILTPNYFTMTGGIDFKVIAQGDKASIYQITGDFQSKQQGEIKILAMEDAIKAIPADWADAQRKWVIKALETVRDFTYRSCSGNLRFYGKEGTLKLALQGPDGERNIEVHSHDRRRKEE